MQLEIPDVMILSLSPGIFKRSATINPSPREISSGDSFGITDWEIAYNLYPGSKGGSLLIEFSLDN